MAETTVGADLLEALKILAELRVDTVGQDLAVLAVDDIALTVQEPGRDLVLGGSLQDADYPLQLLSGELTGATQKESVYRVGYHFRSSDPGQETMQREQQRAGNMLPRVPPFVPVSSFVRWVVRWRQNIPHVQVDIGLLGNDVGIAATATLDLGQGV